MTTFFFQTVLYSRVLQITLHKKLKRRSPKINGNNKHLEKNDSTGNTSRVNERRLICTTTF